MDVILLINVQLPNSATQVILKAKQIKQRLLARTEPARISARSNFHIHRRSCRAKNHRLEDCRFIFMRMPSEKDKLLHVTESALQGDESTIPPAPEPTNVHCPIMPTYHRAILLQIKRPCDFSIE